MRRLVGIMCIIVILMPYFFVPNFEVIGKTLGDLKAELAQKEQDLKNNQNEKNLTQEQIANIKQNISEISNTIENINEQIITLTNEIEELNKQIGEKNEEIKKIVNFLQIANGESAYLEYTFGAKDFTDFIYRAAVSEQLASYNDKLIDEYNGLINSKEETQKELSTEKINLTNKQKELGIEIEKLGNKITELESDAISIEDAIETQKNIIEMYTDIGCKDNEDINECGNKALPPDTVFWRPLNYGYISSNYGYRTYWINGGWTSDFHSGVDMAAAGGSPIYATANGTVAAINWQTKCGGNYVYIYHYVNGKYYTSLYMHMRDIYVNVNDVVTKNTVIGTVGGNPYVEYWDQCSTGEHLHFSIFNGRVGKDYYTWDADYYANRFDPRYAVNFPALEGSFYDRTTRY
ncbi:MAG: peptidoglycan DD-metalloendopeptidase family protein [Bacilli bacterium]|nr:peptidoglycan DD-metalloendopeptidase family protein [Bacilli bacterium]MCI9433823.1 peptidoglycan DD-metalloendopeptidase family protein [Bacilli bacterium]